MAIGKRRRGQPGRQLRVQLPEHDGFVKGCGVQWWYWTGHLQTATGKRYGFEVVFFVFRKWGAFVATLCHHALTDLNARRFYFDQATLPLQLPTATPGRFHFDADAASKVHASGGGGHDHLVSQLGGVTLDLRLDTGEPATQHYEGTAHPYLAGGYTLYYSRKRMQVTGTLTPDRGSAEAVTGEAWFDRQYGELLPAIAAGWQWFGLHIGADTELMIFLFPGQNHATETFASLKTAQGHRVLTPDDFFVQVTGEWPSPHTGARYPSGWRVTIASQGLDLILTPAVVDQELYGEHQYWPGPEYWEGAVDIADADGQPIGRGYVELDGYNRNLFGRLDTD
ncbi:MAG: carotenoid 1,2-hydratase [Deltaproteobacteria bacterium]|nr:carotenoid 1,2-hydratase [Deltaproteobacteria bacterium]